MQRGISAFTRVFDALWLRRTGTQVDGPRIISAPRRKRGALRSIRGTGNRFRRLSPTRPGASLSPMDAEAAPPRSITTHLRGVLNAARGAWAQTARLALDIALPTLCVSCREPVHGEGVCAECWSRLSFIAPPFCPRLGIPFVYDPGPELLSMEAIANPPAYQRARAAVRYDDVARTLVHSLKYQDRTDLAPAMGRWMVRAGQELLDEADVLVPVPLHWRRGWSRRYNQSGALARVISRQTGVKLASEALRRVRATEQQIGLSRSQRASNVQGAFKVAADRSADIQGRRVVLIDDVLTSGATTDACARALLRARAAQVDVLVFARVVDTHRAPI
jgi:ComF family protein